MSERERLYEMRRMLDIGETLCWNECSWLVDSLLAALDEVSEADDVVATLVSKLPALRKDSERMDFIEEHGLGGLSRKVIDTEHERLDRVNWRNRKRVEKEEQG